MKLIAKTRRIDTDFHFTQLLKAPVYSGDAADASKLKEFVDYHRRPVAMMVSKGDQAALQVTS